MSRDVLSEALDPTINLCTATVGLAVSRDELDLTLHGGSTVFAPYRVLVMHAVHFCVATITQHLFISV